MYATAGHVPQREVYQPMRLADNFADVHTLAAPPLPLPLTSPVVETLRVSDHRH